MKLFLMRHAHAEAGSIQTEDIDRNLSDTGIEEAKNAAIYLKDAGIDKIIISFAKRTIQTANILQEQIHVANEQIVKTLYDGNIDTVRDLIGSQEEEQNILVIGHNPLIYNLALQYVNTDDKNYEKLISNSMPTACIVTLEFKELNEWNSVYNSKAELIDIFTP